MTPYDFSELNAGTEAPLMFDANSYPWPTQENNDPTRQERDESLGWAWHPERPFPEMAYGGISDPVPRIGPCI